MAAFSTIAAVGLGAAGIGASVIGGNKAANAVESAAANSDATSLYVYEDIKERNAYREDIGNQALGQIAGMYGLGDQQNSGGSMFGGSGFNSTGGNYGGGVPTQSGGFGGFGGQRGEVLNQNQYAQNKPTQGGQPQQQQMQQNGGQFQDFYNSPDYQLAFNEGQKAIEGSAAARGGLLSGGTAKAITGYGQDLATNTFGNYRNALNNISGIGQQATESVSNAGQNYAAQYGNNQVAIGQANANASINNANTIGNVFSGFGTGLLG